MAEITLDRAVALLSSERQKDRTDGLAGLCHAGLWFLLFFFFLNTSILLMKGPERFEAYSAAKQEKLQIVR